MPTPESDSPTSSSHPGLLGTTRRRILTAAVAIAAITGVTVSVVALTGRSTGAGRVSGGVLGAATTSGPGAATSTATPTPAPGSPTPTPAPASTPAATPASGQGSGTSGSGPAACRSVASTYQTLAASADSFRPGQAVTITATITNTGPACAGAPATAALSVTDPAGHAAGGHSATTSTGIWNHGAVITDHLTLTGNGSEGGYRVSSVWPGYGRGESRSVTENSACTASDLGLQLYTETGHAVGEGVPINSTVSNRSPHSCPLAYTVQVTVTDWAGRVIFSQGTGAATTGGDWAPGQSFTDHFTWQPMIAGNYTVTVRETDHGLTASAAITVT